MEMCTVCGAEGPAANITMVSIPEDGMWTCAGDGENTHSCSHRNDGSLDFCQMCDAKKACYTVGELVERRDKAGSEIATTWRTGYVTNVDPLMVTATNTARDQGFAWDEVRKTMKKATHIGAFAHREARAAAKRTPLPVIPGTRPRPVLLPSVSSLSSASAPSIPFCKKCSENDTPLELGRKSIHRLAKDKIRAEKLAEKERVLKERAERRHAKKEESMENKEKIGFYAAVLVDSISFGIFVMWLRSTYAFLDQKNQMVGVVLLVGGVALTIVHLVGLAVLLCDYKPCLPLRYMCIEIASVLFDVVAQLAWVFYVKTFFEEVLPKQNIWEYLELFVSVFEGGTKIVVAVLAQSMEPPEEEEPEEYRRLQ